MNATVLNAAHLSDTLSLWHGLHKAAMTGRKKECCVLPGITGKNEREKNQGTDLQYQG